MSERPSRVLLYVLAALIFLEGAGIAGGAIYLVIETVVAPSKSIASAIALAVCFAAVAAGLILIGVYLLRTRPWTRNAALCWQVLQVLLGVSILQAQGAASTLYFWILVPLAVAVIVLLFTPSVMRLTARSRQA